MSAEPHRVAWTPERVRRFFDHYASLPGTEDVYFSRQRSRALLRFVRRRVALAGPALDVGCGRGHFLERLAAAGIECVGVDTSAASVEEARRRLAGAPRLRDVRVATGPLRDAFPPASFGAVFIIETLEHLPGADANALLDDARALLRRGGHLVATTPNAEDLSAGEVTCPSCGGVFHRMQHVRAFEASSLRALVASRGFDVILCRPALLLPQWKPWRRARQVEAVRTHLCPQCGAEFHAPRPPKPRCPLARIRSLGHLVCIAAASDSDATPSGG